MLQEEKVLALGIRLGQELVVLVLEYQFLDILVEELEEDPLVGLEDLMGQVVL